VRRERTEGRRERTEGRGERADSLRRSGKWEVGKLPLNL